MSINATIKKVIEYIKGADGTYSAVYRKTLGELVECADGTTVENKVGGIKGIANNLITTTTGLALDATQGKALNDSLATTNSNVTKLQTNVGNNVKIRYGVVNLGFEVDHVIFKHNCRFASVNYTFTCSIQDTYLYVVRVENIDGNNVKITAVKPNPYAPETFSGFAIVRWSAVGV